MRRPDGPTSPVFRTRLLCIEHIFVLAWVTKFTHRGTSQGIRWAMIFAILRRVAQRGQVPLQPLGPTGRSPQMTQIRWAALPSFCRPGGPVSPVLR
jgi:hypothetical protein